MSFIDITGQTFGRYKVLKFVETRAEKAMFLCLCECGVQKEVAGYFLRKGIVKSCGCYRAQRASEFHSRHRKINTKVYRCWCGIRQRCENPKATNYSHYGGRSIKVCERWQTFENFFKDMGDPPSSKHQIDRIDGNGNYEPGNCRWVTPYEQSANIKTNKNLTFNGETMNVSAWARRLGCSKYSLNGRLRLGWSVERTLGEPIKHRRKN